MKWFLRYVDDIVRKIRGEPSCLLDAANSFNSNLQFTLEETSSEGNLPFLDLNKMYRRIGGNLQFVSKANRYWDYSELQKLRSNSVKKA